MAPLAKFPLGQNVGFCEWLHRQGWVPNPGDDECWAMMGAEAPCCIPEFADANGEWIAFAAMAMPVLRP